MTDHANSNDSPSNPAGSVSGILAARSFAFPLAFALVAAGVAGYFNSFSIVALVLLAAAAACLQLTNNIARVYGDRVDRHDVRTEYYERKFERFKMAARKRGGEQGGQDGSRGLAIDPLAGTAGDLTNMRLKGMLLASAAASMVLGYGFVLSCTASLSAQQTGLFGQDMASAAPASMVGLAGCVAIVALVLLRYLGSWSYGYRTYGNTVLFVMLAVAMVGCQVLFACQQTGTWTFLIVYLYPALGIAALGVAVANMRDLELEQHDVEMSRTSRPRRTVPLSAGFKGAVALQIAGVLLSTIWFASFPVTLGEPSMLRYMFAIFFAPMIIDAVSLMRSEPSRVPGLCRSLAVSTLLMSAAFCITMSL